MAVADGTGFPIAEPVGSASPHEVTLVETLLEKWLTQEKTGRLIGNHIYVN
jgi:hypothetical protein